MRKMPTKEINPADIHPDSIENTSARITRRLQIVGVFNLISITCLMVDSYTRFTKNDDVSYAELGAALLVYAIASTRMELLNRQLAALRTLKKARGASGYDEVLKILETGAQTAHK